MVTVVRRLYKLLFQKRLYPYVTILVLLIYILSVLIKEEFFPILFLVILLVAILFVFSKSSLFLVRNLKKALQEHPLIVINLLFIILLSILWVQYTNDFSKRLFAVEARFGGQQKLACNEATLKDKLQKQVVRIIGSYSEGSGFPISYNRILTNFHVIEGEPSPKVVFSDGTFVSPKNILASKDHDLALIVIDKDIDPLQTYASATNDEEYPVIGEPVYAAGYPMGTALTGPITVSVGSYGGQREDKKRDMVYNQTNISLIGGMSGGPLVDACGKVLGINTRGVAGLSLFLDIRAVNSLIPDITEKDVTKIEVDTSTPEGVVKAFYTYIKTRNLQKAYDLVSKQRTKDIPFEEWVNGYERTLHVEVIQIAMNQTDKDKVRVKIESEGWIDNESVFKYFEGEWQVIKEDGTYKLNESNIKEINEPGWEWY